MRPVPLVLLGGCWLDGYGDDLADLVELSVNAASAAADSGGLHMRTEAGTNPVGGFNGTGTGNKAIAGIEGYDGLLLADLAGTSPTWWPRGLRPACVTPPRLTTGCRRAS